MKIGDKYDTSTLYSTVCIYCNKYEVVSIMNMKTRKRLGFVLFIEFIDTPPSDTPNSDIDQSPTSES